MNEKRNLSDEKLSKVNGGELHMDPQKTYRFTCKNCNITFPKSGVGDNTLVQCPTCGRNVR